MPPLTPAQTFARLDSALTGWKRGTASIAVSSRTPSGWSRAAYTLSLDGKGGIQLRVKTPARGSNIATDQGFVIRGGGAMGIDYVAREVLLRRAPDQGSVPLRILAVMGQVDDSIGFLTDRETRTRYLQPLRSLTGWQRTATGLYRRTSMPGKVSTARLDLDASGKLTRLHVEFPGSVLDWTVRYGAFTPLPVPKGLRKVEAFTVHQAPPKYADAHAKAVAEAMLKSSANLRNAIVRIDNEATLWVGGSKIRYERAGAGFAFDGKLLTIKTPGAWYRGRASRGAVIDYVASLLGSVDPLARSILVRTPPYSEIFVPDAKVRVVGTMSAGGAACDVLSVDSPKVRASLFIRKADHLPASVESDTLDRRGNSIARSERSLTWSSVGSPVAAGVFALRVPAGTTVLPLPKRTP